MKDIFDSIKKISCKILYEENFKGTGIIINDSNHKSFCFTAAHVLYGKDLNNCVDKSKIKVQLFNYQYQEVKDIKIRKSFRLEEYDIMAIEIDFFEVPFSVIITDSHLFNEKLLFCGHPKTLDNQVSFFNNNELLDSCNNDRFNLSADSKYLSVLQTQSLAALNGISGSGVFYKMEQHLYILGLVIGFKDDEGTFSILDCIHLKSFAEEVSSHFNFGNPIPNIENIMMAIDQLKNKSDLSAINEYKSKNHEFVCNLIRKNHNITGKIDVNTEVNNHIESFLYGAALLNWYDENGFNISDLYRDIFDSYKRKLRLSSIISIDEVEASNKYQDICKEFQKLIFTKLEKTSLPVEKIIDLSNYGISSMMAICELDIKNKGIES